MERYIDTNIFLAYSPDEGIWYLEKREPGNWADSEQVYCTEDEAIEAYKNNDVVWEDA